MVYCNILNEFFFFFFPLFSSDAVVAQVLDELGLQMADELSGKLLGYFTVRNFSLAQDHNIWVV